MTAAVLLGAVGCSASNEFAQKNAPTVVVSPEMADAALQAVDNWVDGTAGDYQAHVVLSNTCAEGDWCIVPVARIADCNAEGVQLANEAIGGCTHRAEKRIEIWRDAPADLMVSLLMHEIGHSVGLADVPGSRGLMDPHRSNSSAAIDGATLLAFEAELEREN